jgi:hypothetical protein
VVREARDPCREGYRRGRALPAIVLAEAHGSHALADGLYAAPSVFDRRARQEQAELLAAEARGGGVRLPCVRQRLRHGEDHPVAHQVAEAVVDLAQVVEVHDRHG